MNRRELFRLGRTGLLSALVTSGYLSAIASRGQAAPSADRVLVWLELRGGNDGLNTVIPYRDTLYLQARPGLAITEGPSLNRDLILHPALAPLHPIWQARRLAFALGVGWPQPNRSHFRAMDQWSTASMAGDGPGWLAIATDRRRSPGPLVALDPSGSRALDGGKALSVQLSPSQLAAAPGLDLDPSRAGNNGVLRRILELEADGHQALTRLREGLAPLPQSLNVPRSAIGQQVSLALRLIGSRAAPPVIHMAHVGYDTHLAQPSRHARVLSELAEALAAFDQGLQLLPRRPQVTLLATSEFGRRLRQNKSDGTDHGSASIAFLLGDHVPHPLIGSYPSLSHLDDRGDLVATLPPPRLYEQVLAL